MVIPHSTVKFEGGVGNRIMYNYASDCKMLERPRKMELDKAKGKHPEQIGMRKKSNK